MKKPYHSTRGAVIGFTNEVIIMKPFWISCVRGTRHFVGWSWEMNLWKPRGSLSSTAPPDSIFNIQIIDSSGVLRPPHWDRITIPSNYWPLSVMTSAVATWRNLVSFKSINSCHISSGLVERTQNVTLTHGLQLRPLVEGWKNKHHSNKRNNIKKRDDFQYAI